jgi:hypothetical protein
LLADVAAGSVLGFACRAFGPDTIALVFGVPTLGKWHQEEETETDTEVKAEEEE